MEKLFLLSLLLNICSILAFEQVSFSIGEPKPPKHKREHGIKLSKQDIQAGDKLALEENKGPPEDDIVTEDNGGPTQNAEKPAVRPWPKARIPVFIPEGVFSDAERAAFARAFCEIESKSCVRFIQLLRTPKSGNYIHFSRGKPKTCSSNVGMIGGVQYIRLEHIRKKNERTSKCFRAFGNVVHELLHAIGASHEHTRNDRDNYVNINPNAIAEQPSNYEIKNPPSENYGGAKDPGYDLGSIMHYGDFNGTLLVKNKADPDAKHMGQREQLSPKDVEKLRSWNKCDKRPIPPASEFC